MICGGRNLRFSPFYYSYSTPLREVRCFPQTPQINRTGNCRVKKTPTKKALRCRIHLFSQHFSDPLRPVVVLLDKIIGVQRKRTNVSIRGVKITCYRGNQFGHYLGRHILLVVRDRPRGPRGLLRCSRGSFSVRSTWTMASGLK